MSEVSARRACMEKDNDSLGGEVMGRIYMFSEDGTDQVFCPDVAPSDRSTTRSSRCFTIHNVARYGDVFGHREDWHFEAGC